MSKKDQYLEIQRNIRESTNAYNKKRREDEKNFVSLMDNLNEKEDALNDEILAKYMETVHQAEWNDVIFSMITIDLHFAVSYMGKDGQLVFKNFDIDTLTEIDIDKKA